MYFKIYLTILIVKEIQWGNNFTGAVKENCLTPKHDRTDKVIVY